MPEDILSLTPPPADKRVSYGSDPSCIADLRFPHARGPHPVVVNIHGGFWRNKYSLEHAGHICAALTSNGFATCNVEYRRVGDPGGGWPGTLDDIRSGLHFLQENAAELNLDSNQFVVMGHSAGGHLALALAAYEPSVTKVISLAGVVDLQQAWGLHLSNDAVAEFLGGTPEEVPECYQQADPMLLNINGAEQWLVHGSDDDVVPPEFSRDYVRQKRGKCERVQLLEIAGANHFDVIDPRSSAWKQIEEIILKDL